jgi:hypothetical protein
MIERCTAPCRPILAVPDPRAGLGSVAGGGFPTARARDDPAACECDGRARLWEEQNTAAEHRKEAARLGGPDADRLSLCNALLGGVQAQAVLADGAGGVSAEQRDAAWRKRLRSAGTADDPGALDRIDVDALLGHAPHISR